MCDASPTLVLIKKYNYVSLIMSFDLSTGAGPWFHPWTLLQILGPSVITWDARLQLILFIYILV